jgi:hypothetical protein
MMRADENSRPDAATGMQRFKGALLKGDYWTKKQVIIEAKISEKR